MAILSERILKLGRFLSLVLRHDPKHAGIELDEHGWCEIAKLLINKALPMTFEELQEVVDTDNKNRFTFSEDRKSVRAAQGHSVSVDVQLEVVTDPPEFLYHGTAIEFLPDILKLGLLPQNRLYVHLSLDVETAILVGKRHGKPVVLIIPTKPLIDAGYPIYIAENGVYQSKEVPPNFIAQM